ncbi:unnamed protein product, partial [Mesorhabditis spiculigera]
MQHRKHLSTLFLALPLVVAIQACELKIKIRSHYPGKMFVAAEFADGSTKILKLSRAGKSRTVNFSAPLCGLYMTTMKTFSKTPRGLDGVPPISQTEHGLDGKGTVQYEIDESGEIRLTDRDLTVWCAFGKCPLPKIAENAIKMH